MRTKIQLVDSDNEVFLEEEECSGLYETTLEGAKNLAHYKAWARFRIQGHDFDEIWELSPYTKQWHRIA